MNHKYREALEKLAYGGKDAETTLEYVEREGVLCAVKKKESVRERAPDLKALMLLREEEGFGSISDEELLKEKEKLEALLTREKKDE